jgi:uncharacterized BrkB/YihY/UPF0761 family membrane protein
VVRRERPVAVGILAASLAFRLFALMVPLIYVLVAGLGFAAQASADQGTARPGDELADLVVASVADATHSSQRAGWLALSLAMPRPPSVSWTALVPGSLLFGAGFQAFSVAVSLWFAPRAARASTLYGSLGVALVLLVSLFLFARLAVAAAELNATLVERRRLERR